MKALLFFWVVVTGPGEAERVPGLRSDVTPRAPSLLEDFDLAAWSEAYAGFLSSKEDDGAIECLHDAVVAYPKMEEGVQKKLVKAVQKGLGRRRPEDDNRLFLEVVKTFGEMPGAGEAAAMKALRHKNVDKRPVVLAGAISAVAAHANPKSIKLLVQYLVHRDAHVIAATVEGLGEFDRAKDADRKQIVSELVKQYSAIYSNSLPQGNTGREAGAPKKRVNKESLRITQSAFEASLHRLTGASVRGASEWIRWYGKNRKKRWPAPDGSKK